MTQVGEIFVPNASQMLVVNSRSTQPGLTVNATPKYLEINKTVFV